MRTEAHTASLNSMRTCLRLKGSKRIRSRINSRLVKLWAVIPIDSRTHTQETCLRWPNSLRAGMSAEAALHSRRATGQSRQQLPGAGPGEGTIWMNNSDPTGEFMYQMPPAGAVAPAPAGGGGGGKGKGDGATEGSQPLE